MLQILRKGCVMFAMGACSLNSAAGDGTCTAHSAEYTVALLELYTSEGCSSCPPADHFLSSLKNAGNVPSSVIPLALHVDYWDYIGWKDPFARPQFSKRQREMANRGKASVVYTPQFSLQGEIYRLPSDSSSFEFDLRAINRKPSRADLTVNLGQVEPGKLTVSVSGSVRGKIDEKGAMLYLALYENNLTSSVRAGENRNAVLHHDHVVRAWSGPWTVSAKDKSAVNTTLSLAPQWKVRDLGIAVFVQNTLTGEILQAVSRNVCS